LIKHLPLTVKTIVIPIKTIPIIKTVCCRETRYSYQYEPGAMPAMLSSFVGKEQEKKPPAIQDGLAGHS
jgi:hypothetical protein